MTLTTEQFALAEIVIRQCIYPGYIFRLEVDGRGEAFLQAEYVEADTVTGDEGKQLTRRWFISPHMTKSEIVQTVFKCVLTSMEHRAREWFRWKGQPVFCPHFDVEALYEICQKGRFEHR